MTDKPRKTLTGATFIGRNLYGDHPTTSQKVVKVSKIVARLGPTTFETLNTIYDVKWLPGAEVTIPMEWAHYV